MVEECQNWGEQFKIEFDIKITKLPTITRNVLHFTANDKDCCDNGNRIPAVYVLGDKLKVISSISGNYNYEAVSFACVLEQMYHVIIQQYKGLTDDYWFEIIIDDESKFKIQNKFQRSFSNVKFYASNPWLDPFSSEFGSIGNITISK